MSGRELMQEIASNPKIASVVSAATVGTGAGTFLDWIPSDIGKLATLVGLILTSILIRSHLLNMKKLKLELILLEEERHYRQERARHRKEAGEPVRRLDDEG